MTQPVHDRNALLCALAVRHNFLTPAALATARGEWERDPTRSLGQVLLARGLLRPKGVRALETLVEDFLEVEASATTQPENQPTLDPRSPSRPSVGPFAT